MNKALDAKLGRNDKAVKKGKSTPKPTVIAEAGLQTEDDAQDSLVVPQPGIEFVWYDQARAQVPETLYAFMVGLLAGFKHTEESFAHASAAAMLGAFAAMARAMPFGEVPKNLTPMVTMSVLQELTSARGQPVMPRNFMHMLHPGNKDAFTSVPKTVYKRMVDTAKAWLKEAEDNPEKAPPPEVVEHWKRVAAGYIPFGYRLGA